MAYLVAVDGGGSKTRFALASDDGLLLDTLVTETIHPNQQATPGQFQERFKTALSSLLSRNRLTLNAIEYFGIGMPGFGAFPEYDCEVIDILNKTLGAQRYSCHNDVFIAWYAYHGGGSGAGIHIVSGTGSIAFARNAQGDERCTGGWGPVLGDEGSGFWLGLRAAEYFTKQADGRLPKDALYELVRQHLSLKRDDEIISALQNAQSTGRQKIASLSKPLFEAAAHSVNAREILKAGASELAQLCRPFVMSPSLFYNTPSIPLSCSGGIFHHSASFMAYFDKALAKVDARLIRYSKTIDPIYGAIEIAKAQIK